MIKTIRSFFQNLFGKKDPRAVSASLYKTPQSFKPTSVEYEAPQFLLDVNEHELAARVERKQAQKASKPEGEDTMPPGLPVYGSKLGLSMMPAGLYLGLFHGREKPDAELKEWGANGPVIGPLRSIQSTYGNSLKVDLMQTEHLRRFFPQEIQRYKERGFNLQGTETSIPIHNRELVYYGGSYFGDWEIFYFDGKNNPYQG